MAKGIRQTLGEFVKKEEGKIGISFQPIEVQELIKKGAVKATDSTHDIYVAICARFGMTPRKSDRISIARIVRESGVERKELAKVLAKAVEEYKARTKK